MKTYEELCDALRGEEIELSLKIEHLENFLMTEEYQTISTRQKELLASQLQAMQAYKSALIERVLQARFEHRQKTGDTCTSEPEKEERIEPHVIDAIRYQLDREKKAEAEEEDHLCYTCYYRKDSPDGPRCKMCDNCSCWEKKEAH